MKIPSESYEAVGYCLLSIKSIDDKYCICEIDVSCMSEKSNISDSSSNVVSESYSDNEENLGVSDIDFNIDISDIDLSDIDLSDIDLSDIDTFYIKNTIIPDIIPHIIVKKHEEKNIREYMNFHEFFCILSTIIESFVFEEASYLFDIFG
jgi:hypothetical protein